MNIKDAVVGNFSTATLFDKTCSRLLFSGTIEFSGAFLAAKNSCVNDALYDACLI